MRIVITGPPQSGKTHLAQVLHKLLGFPIYGTDELKDLEWSEASAEASMWFGRSGPWIIEGVVVPRALRKWRLRHNDLVEPPFDKIIVLRHPRGPLQLQGQQTMSKQVLGLIDTMKDWIGDKWIES